MITGNLTDRQPEGPLYERLVEPAILALLDSSDGSYRCERDLHHHLTVCLDRVQPLNLGSRQTRMHAEEPAVACYGSGRHGNIDFFLAEDCYQNHSHSGIAVELNWNYSDPLKVERDLCKLVDPKNGYPEAAYFAFGTRHDLLKAVQMGLERTFTTFIGREPSFLLPAGLHVMVAVLARPSNVVRTYSAAVTESCEPSQVRWSESQVYATDRNKGRTKKNMHESLTLLEDKMSLLTTEEDLDLSGPSYQTAPLSEYGAQHQQIAEDLFVRISNWGLRTVKYKGSYSIYMAPSHETAAKIIIFEEGKGRLCGGSHFQAGVYLLIRANGHAGERNNAALVAHSRLTSFPSSDTVGIAPAHRERFRYLRVDEATIDSCLELLLVCTSA